MEKSYDALMDYAIQEINIGHFDRHEAECIALAWLLKTKLYLIGETSRTWSPEGKAVLDHELVTLSARPPFIFYHDDKFKKLLMGLIDLGENEDSNGQFRIILNYENSGDVAQVLDGNGNVLGDSTILNLDTDDSEEEVRLQFIEAIEAALKNKQAAQTGQTQMQYPCGEEG